MRKLIATVVLTLFLSGAWLGLGTGAAHADSGPWLCVGAQLIDWATCLSDPLPDRLPYI